MNEIYTLQKQCVRLMSKDKTKSIDYLFKKPRVIKFPDMIQMKLCKFGFKLAKNKLLEPLKALMESRGKRKAHKYNTRSKHIPNIHKHNTIQYNTSFLCKSVAEFSKVSKNLTAQSKIRSFTKELKIKIIEGYA